MVKLVGQDQSQVKRVTCKNCASVLEYTVSEIEKHEGRDCTGESDEYEHVKFPSCNSKVILRA